MLAGTYIFHDGSGTTAVHTPPFARRGQAATFTLDVTQKAGSPTMIVTIEHKNREDTDWSTLTTFSDITATGVASKDVGSLKELVRLAFTFTAGSVGNYYFVVFGRPSWRVYN
jgi:hypothetical protein